MTVEVASGGTMDRAVTSDTRRPGFKTGHWKILMEEFDLLNLDLNEKQNVQRKHSEDDFNLNLDKEKIIRDGERSRVSSLEIPKNLKLILEPDSGSNNFKVTQDQLLFQ